MTLNQLSYFLEAARHEHVGRAAKSLAISPSAISHAISALEAELDCELFAREGKRIYLTDRGRTLAQHAADVTRRLGTLKQELSLAPAWEGRIRMGATHDLATACLTPAWTELVAAHPRLRGEVRGLRSIQVVHQLLEGEIDFGLCYGAPRHASLERAMIHEGFVEVCAGRHHPLFKHPAAKRLKNLAAFPLAVPRSIGEAGPEEQCGLESIPGVRREYDLTFDHYDVAIRFLEASHGWSLIPDWMVARHPAIAVLAVPEVRERFTITAVWPKHRDNGPFGELVKLCQKGLRAKSTRRPRVVAGRAPT